MGALMACGICLIAYKGESKVEDYVLNFAGFNAFFVALVPNSFAEELAVAKAAETSDNPPVVSSQDVLQNLGIGLAAFLAVAVAFVVLDRMLFNWKRFRWEDRGRLARLFVLLSWALEAVLLGIVLFVVWMVLSGDDKTWAFKAVHFGAATLMIVNLAFAASSHAFPGRLRSKAETTVAPVGPGMQIYFRVISIGMVAGLPAAGIAWCLDFSHTVISIEIYEIVFFIAYWIAATREEWSGTLGIPGRLLRQLRRA